MRKQKFCLIPSHRVNKTFLTLFVLCVLGAFPAAAQAGGAQTAGDTVVRSGGETNPADALAVLQESGHLDQALLAAMRTTGAETAGASNGAAEKVRYANLPLAFEPNHGQTDSRVKFLARGSGYALFLTSQEAVLELKQPGQHQGSVVRMKLLGSNPVALAMSGEDELPGKSNYLIGRDQSKWRTNVPNYAKVTERGVYTGVDLVYYGHQRQLEYDFVVGAGADANVVRLQVDGARKLRVDAAGDLLVEIPGGELSFHKPVAYQELSGARRPVDAGYVLEGENNVAFHLGKYDSTAPLVIDPILQYSTYLGGSSIDGANAIAVLSSDGTAFVTGGTFSADFPTQHPLQPNVGGPHDFPNDAFVAKLSADGATVLYSTYLGGSEQEVGNGIAVDSLGDAYVTGMTLSKDFPATAGSFDPNCPPDGQCGAKVNDGLIWSAGFLAELNPAGSALVYSTFFGGSGNTRGQAVAVDNAQNAYVNGLTQAPDFPLYAIPCIPFTGPQNAFLLKFDSTGARALYSGVIGGSVEESGLGVAVDANAIASVTGITYSQDFPVTASAFQSTYGGAGDAFLTTINTNLCSTSRVYSTYLGGSGLDQGNGVAIDHAGLVYVTGLTKSSGTGAFPTIAGAYQTACKLDAQGGCDGDAFVSKLDPSKSGAASLLSSTYLGGTNGDSGNGIALDPSKNIYITGSTNSTDFPVTTAVFQSSYGGGNADAFITKLDPTASTVLYSSYLGGTNTESGNGIAVDTSGAAYVAGQTCSTDFPLSNPAQLTPGGNCDAFVSKVIVSPGIALSPAGLTFGAQLVNTTSAAETITLDNGDSALTITSITVTGANASDFAENNTCGTTQAAGGQCTISVTFTPTAAGIRTAAITIVDSAPGSPHVANLTGTGTPTGILTLSPTSLTFPNEDVGSPSTAQSILVTNTGNAALTISGIVASGDYSEKDDCTKAPLQPTTNCSIQVTFTPSVSGSSVGALTITDDAPGSPQIVLLTGNGVLTGGGSGGGSGGSGGGSDFSLSTPTASESAFAGTPVHYAVTITPSGGFTGKVSLTCQMPAALAQATCSVSPDSVTPDGTDPVQTTVTVTTTARTMVPPGPNPVWPFSHGPALPTTWLVAIVAAALMTIVAAKRRRILLGLGLATLSVMMCVGCGSSGKSFNSAGTPAGNYTLTINGTSGSVVHSTAVTLTVN